MKANCFFLAVFLLLAPTAASAQFEFLAVPEPQPALGDVDLILEADTIVPSFYSGRAELSSGSRASVVAIPYSDSGSVPNGLYYQWLVNGTPQSPEAVLARNKIEITAPQTESLEVELRIYTGTGRLFAEKIVEFPLVRPYVSFYEDNPLRGLEPLAIRGSHLLVGDEVSFRAVPWYFDNRMSSADNLLTWELNRREVDNNNEDNMVITLVRPESLVSSYLIGFSLRNTKSFLQDASGEFQLNINQ